MIFVTRGKSGTADNQTGSLRSWLASAIWEGAFANVFITLTGGAFITGLALLWGASDFHIGLLAAIPFIAQVAQLASPLITGKLKSRKFTAVLFSGISRQMWWVVALIMLMDIPWKLEALLVVVMFSGLGIMIATPAWMAWMADLVPEGIRGRYFGVRSAVLSVVAVIAVLVGGVILDSARARGNEQFGFFIVISLSSLCAAVALVILTKIPDPAAGQIFSFIRTKFWEPIQDRSFRRLLGVFLTWNLAIGLAAPFFAAHMLTNLRMSFTLISIYSGVSAAPAILLNKPWGSLIDRFGSKPVVAFCAFGIGAIPFFWLFPRYDSLWILAIEAVYSGIMWTGFTLAAFNIPIANSPQPGRAHYLAMFNVVTGVAFFISSLLGGALAEWWQEVAWKIGPQTIVNYHLLFVLTGLLRLAAAALILTFHEAREQRIPIMIQFMGYAILKWASAERQIFPWSPKRRDE